MAERLSISTKTLKRHLDKQGVAYLKVGNRILVDPQAVEAAFTCIQRPDVPIKKKIVPARGRFAERLGL